MVAYSVRCVPWTLRRRCLILFLPLQSLLTMGVEGGREAASRLRQHIAGHFGSNTDILVHIFFNREGLGSTIKKYLGIAGPTFNAFINGFNTASPLMSMLDVGVGKESADAKIRGACIFLVNFPVDPHYYYSAELMRIFVRFPHGETSACMHSLPV